MCLADGCTNSVWYEPGLPESLRSSFAYCSPGCRDRHLLPIRRQQLSNELEELKQELQRAAASDSGTKTVQQQPSYSVQPPITQPGANISSLSTPAKGIATCITFKNYDNFVFVVTKTLSGLVTILNNSCLFYQALILTRRKQGKKTLS